MTPAGRNPLVQVKGLSKHYKTRTGIFAGGTHLLRAVDNVDFSIGEGETLGLVGESGCGKSTIGRLLLRLIEPTAGSAWFEGRDLFSLSSKEMLPLRRKIQIVFQDPFGSLNPRMTVGEMLAEPLMLHRLVPANRRAARVAELLHHVGLDPSHAARFPHEFSGGQRQRIGIARALAVEPKLIVCDEPVSALDVSVQAQIINLLSDLQKKFSLSLLFIAHNLAVVRHVAHRVAVMYLGQIVEMAPTETLFAAPRHPYTQALLAAIPIPDPSRRKPPALLEGDVPNPLTPPTGCRFHPRCHYAASRCMEVEPLLQQTGDDRQIACHFWPEIAAQKLNRQASSPPIQPSTLERLQAAFVKHP